MLAKSGHLIGSIVYSVVVKNLKIILPNYCIKQENKYGEKQNNTE